jgi:CRISPR/Cas system-associated exonuclease Cas4 (RecB family)
VQEWYSGEWQLFNECDIIYKTENGLHTRRPDRVMRKDNQVIVLDFKFGEQKREQHNMQVKEYMTLLAQMGCENISGYLWYVEKESIEAV